ncbi:PEPxxWA-CTERM sorting domain-containing protein [Phenylobacterium sp.]|uniref:PEPxxWA-CTERM sorting domain-containing protein n=1 Tax=Phenylobacterium sp. TaxID=1871053 RepID=UPI003D2DF34C
MKVRVLGAVAALLLAAPATEAAAKSIKIDAVGTVQFGSDGVGLFGGGSLAGAAFSFTATLDLTNAAYLNSGFRTDILGGDAYAYLPGPTPPSLGNAVMTIKGIDTTIVANWNTTLTAFAGGFDQQHFQQRFLPGAEDVIKAVTLMEQPGFGLFDLATYTPPSGNLCAGGHVCNSSNFQAEVAGFSTFAQLNPTSITMTELAPPPPPPPPIPEPGTWALMIGGFGLAGGALRRRRQTATA